MGLRSGSRIVGVVALCAGLAAGALAAPASAAPGAPGQDPGASPLLLSPETGATDQLIVTPAAGKPLDTASLSDDAGDDVTSVRRTDRGSYVVKLPDRLPAAEVDALAQEWTARPDVALAEPDRIRTIQRTPNDPQYTNQWDLKAPAGGQYGANLPGAWDVTTGSSSVVVAVLDTGRLNHADLAGKFVAGYDFVNDSQVANDGSGRDSDPSDPGDWITSAENASGYFKGCQIGNSSWHGTHVAGTIGANSDNATGVAGIAWGVKILPVRVLGKCGGYDSDIIDALKWSAGLSVSGVPANANPAQVINLSLGGSGACSAAWQTAINAVTAAGTTVVIAGGNSNVDVSGASPGNCNGVITVAATGRNGNRAYYSNYGAGVEIAAQGGDKNLDPGILSTLNAGTTSPGADSYAYYQGTSMATPHVAGVAALIKSVRPSATPAQVLTYLQGNVTPFPAGSTCTTSICGTGILNADAAVRAAASAPGAPGTPTATAGNGQADVSWTAPSSDGGTPVTGYTVTPFIGATAQSPQVFASTATTQTVTGLANGTTYTFTVAATNLIGTGSPSPASNAVTPAAPAAVPGAPTVGTATAGDASAQLGWTAPASDGGSAITGYRVTPYVGAVAQPAQDFASTATSQTITGLANGTTYTFTVAATNAMGTGAASAASNAVTPQAAASVPGAPTVTKGVSGNQQVKLTWTAPASDGGSPITGYQVTPAVDGVPQAPRVFTSTATTQTIGSLVNGTAYTFTVAAVNAQGSGTPSGSFGPVSAGAPGAPGFQSAQPGNLEAKVGWFAPSANGSAITGYVITPYVDGVAQTPQLFDASATKVFATGLTNGVTYRFGVAAVNARGTGEESLTNAVIVGTPSEPGFPNVVPGTTTVRMSWLIPPGNGAPVQGYVVTPYIGSTAQTPIVFNSPSRFQTITGLTQGVTYRFDVAAFNSLGTGPAASSATIVEGSPEAPWFQAAAPADQGATVKFTPPPANGAPIQSYTVWPVQGSTVMAPQVFATPSATQLAVTGLTNGVEYSFRVSATNSLGTSPYATTNKVVAGEPTAPSFVSAQPRDGGAKVAWTASAANGAPITSYVITPYIGNSAQTPQVFAGTATNQIVTGLTNGVAYTFRVAAVNAIGTGPEDKTWDPIVAGAPTAPGWPSATAGDASALVKWQAAASNGSAITGYVVTPYVGKVAQAPQLFDASSLTRTITGLANGVTYTFQITAVNARGASPAAKTPAVTPTAGP